MEELKRLFLFCFLSIWACCIYFTNPPITSVLCFLSLSLSLLGLCYKHKLEDLISYPGPAMPKKSCPEGQAWDNLLRLCHSRQIEPSRKPHPPTEPTLVAVNQLRAKTNIATADTLLVQSPVFWVCVIVTTLGSILALTLWFVRFRRQTVSGNSEDAVPELEHLQKTQPPPIFNPPPSDRNGQSAVCQREAEAPSPSQCLHFGAQTGSTMEDGFTACRVPAEHGGIDGAEGLSAYSTSADHKVPLPATELGGTALVTTKTLCPL